MGTRLCRCPYSPGPLRFAGNTRAARFLKKSLEVGWSKIHRQPHPLGCVCTGGWEVWVSTLPHEYWGKCFHYSMLCFTHLRGDLVIPSPVEPCSVPWLSKPFTGTEPGGLRRDHTACTLALPLGLLGLRAFRPHRPYPGNGHNNTHPYGRGKG